MPTVRAMQSVVEFDNVGLRYGTGPETLTDVTFKLYPGSFYFLTGASGAGKTSLLKLLYLAHRPSRGAIQMFGEDAVTLPRDRLPGFRRRIGVVFQDFRLVSHLSAFDNIALPLRIAGIQEKDLRGPVTEMLKWIGLTERAEARPATLSGGEQQMVALGRAVMARPRVLLLDEPSGGLSPQFVNEIGSIIAALKEDGATMLMIEQNLGLAFKVADRFIILRDGVVVDGGTVADYADDHEQIVRSIYL